MLRQDTLVDMEIHHGIIIRWVLSIVTLFYSTIYLIDGRLLQIHI